MYAFIFKSLSDSSGKQFAIFHLSVVTKWLLHMSRILFALKHHLDSITNVQAISCRHLFAGHMMGSWPMKRKEKCITALNDNFQWLFEICTDICPCMLPGSESSQVLKRICRTNNVHEQTFCTFPNVLHLCITSRFKSLASVIFQFGAILTVQPLSTGHPEGNWR